MKCWLPYKETALFDSEVIHLQIYNEDKWKRLRDRFSNIISVEERTEFNAQLKRFKINYPDIKNNLGSKPLLEVWLEQSTKFPLLYRFVRALMVLPYSSCSIERTFSKLTDIKTLKRNRLSVECLEACLLVKQEFCGSTLSFTSSMLNKYHLKEDVELQISDYNYLNNETLKRQPVAGLQTSGLKQIRREDSRPIESQESFKFFQGEDEDLNMSLQEMVFEKDGDLDKGTMEEEF